ncbi:hypothetical protein FF38_01032 [Lucilia cuprina]|uniref:Uncharacterized protein n=1 Tax=Lucilia cuprina TaxID=7375 RepID=A0A0L0BVJ3_LUCCU|nr:uncharacterized protein LOC111683205 [Lucilia cuprina]KAI8126766.1 hypothetical protein CVS40_3269 [Lucilia cuprina]KNC23249.1 hypothetical protein FF38_01032 [Lucilia cuprina]
MILAARKHLFATNIIFFFIIYVVQKFIQVFCIIEEKACNNDNCSANNICNDRCKPNTVSVPLTAAPSIISPPQSPKPQVKGLRLIPLAMRKTMRNFGYGEGHYQMFVEEKQRKQHTSKARLNAAVAEVKLNPN